MNVLMSNLKTVAALKAIEEERVRQEGFVKLGRFQHTCADAAMPAGEKLAVLSEEVGEVARCINERSLTKELRTELIQVAAVAVAWAESLDVVS